MARRRRIARRGPKRSSNPLLYLRLALEAWPLVTAAAAILGALAAGAWKLALLPTMERLTRVEDRLTYVQQQNAVMLRAMSASPSRRRHVIQELAPGPPVPDNLEGQ